MAFFTPATRKKAKLRMALTGVSGSGKTLGALLIASGITNGDWSKVALIDTEHTRSLFYASRPDLGTGAFLFSSLEPPFSPDRYIDYVTEAAEAVGPDGVVIVDSLTHAWNSIGGVLDIKDRIADKPGKNSYTAWNEAGREQTKLINAILAVDCHTICTMRSKMEYTLEENERGKKVPVKLGLAPTQRDDTEYEFDVVLDIARDHSVTVSKDTTFLHGEDAPDTITPYLGEVLKVWLDSGEEPARCTVCGKLIQPVGKRSAEEIIHASEQNMGQAACMDCYRAWHAEKKAKAEAETSEAAGS